MPKNYCRVWPGLALLLCLATACQPPEHDTRVQQQVASAEATREEKTFKEQVEAFEDQGRDAWQKPEAVIALFGNLTGKVVADIGAGSGYFSFRLARQARQVWAIDIDPRFLKYIETKNEAQSEPLPIKTRLGKADTPGLAAGLVDAVLVVNTYHHIDARIDYFRAVWQAMKPGARLVVVDYKKGDLPLGPPDKLKLSVDTMQQELKAAGFRLLAADPVALPYQHVLLLEK
ncbi:MAG: class I SAM-dependent methyltransferase [Sphingobacteriia bacterium]|jgi:SAM-dependent methyltransferase